MEVEGRRIVLAKGRVEEGLPPGESVLHGEGRSRRERRSRADGAGQKRRSPARPATASPAVATPRYCLMVASSLGSLPTAVDLLRLAPSMTFSKFDSDALYEAH